MTMRRRTATYLALSLLLVGAGLWGCGGQKSNQTGSSTSTPAPAPTTGDTSAGGGEVSLAIGEKVFQERCATCHGPQGMGDGPGGAALNPKPRNFHDASYMSTLTDEKINETIHNGKPGTAMPAWKGILSESEIKSVILKVRSFSKSS
jgi:mono/diheme cytochrome c family protein